MKFIGDVGDRHGRLCQQAFCFFHPQMRNILIRRREATLPPLALKRSVREAVLARQHSPIRRLFEIQLKIGYDFENLPESVRLGIRLLLVCQKKLLNEPPAEHIDPYGTCEPLDMPYEERKIALPEQSEAGEPFPVRKYHIDTNEHVNNCQYVQMALEMVPGDIQVRQLRVDYKKSAVLGDMIYPRMTAEQERTVVELCDADGKPYAIVEMK